MNVIEEGVRSSIYWAGGGGGGGGAILYAGKFKTCTPIPCLLYLRTNFMI